MNPTAMGKRGKNGKNQRFKEQLLFWVAMQNIGMGILLKEGYQLGHAIGGGDEDNKWPVEIMRCGVCELPKPAGVQSGQICSVLINLYCLSH